MKIKRLEIENFRGFRKAAIDFPEGNLAVFIGNNGAGKSSVLDLIAVYLNVISIHFLKTGAFLNDFFISKSDTRKGSGSGETTIFIDTDFGTIEHGTKTSDTEAVVNYGGTPFYDNIRGKLLWIKKEKANIPILVYYQAGRFFDNSSPLKETSSDFELPQYEAFENAFSKKTKGFNDFLHSFRKEEDLENELIIREKNFNLTQPALDAIRQSILRFFPKIGLDLTKLRVKRESPNPLSFGKNGYNYSLDISKNGQDFRLEQLSDGEKMLLMVVADIARRLAIANPAPESGSALDGKGIVLIDEIELHLHPKWQREVIPALMATFPNVQFVVTTHSPQVLSRVAQSDVFEIEGGEVFGLGSSPLGRDSTGILEEIMDTPKYPAEIDPLVKQLFREIQAKKFDAALQTRQKLAEATDTENPILKQADSMMERFKALA